MIDETCSDTCRDRPSEPGEYIVRLEVPLVLNYTAGFWLGSPYGNFLDVPAVATLPLEGTTKDRPDRVVELLLPLVLQQLSPDSAG